MLRWRAIQWLAIGIGALFLIYFSRVTWRVVIRYEINQVLKERGL
jgi:hypothetical protein